MASHLVPQKCRNSAKRMTHCHWLCHRCLNSPTVSTFRSRGTSLTKSHVVIGPTTGLSSACPCSLAEDRSLRKRAGRSASGAACAGSS